MKKFLVNLGLALSVILILLLSLEVFLRITHVFGARISWSDPDPLLGWRFVPNGRFTYLEENPKPLPFKTNQFGWKDRDWKIEKAPGTYRVAVLGDSYVEAMPVEDESNFLRLAEKKLASAGNKTEWMNFGRSGTTQSEEYLILKNEILRFHPDLVILFFFPVNDIDDMSRETAPDITRPFFNLDAQHRLVLDTSFNQTPSYFAKKTVSRFKQHSALLSLLSQRFSLLTQEKRVQRIQNNGSENLKLRGYLSLETEHPDPLYQKNYALSKRLIEEMAALTKENGTQLMLVTIDTPAYRPSVEVTFKTQDPSFDPLFFEKDLEVFSSRIGIRYLGLESLFREAYIKKGYPLHWQYWETNGRGPYWEYAAHTGHWNYEGHEVVAEALVEKMTAKK